MPGQKPTVSDQISEKIQRDFRDMQIEYQLVAYLLRVNAASVSLIDKLWFSDIILQDIIEIIADLRITLSKAMLIQELRQRSMIRREEEGLYTDAVASLYKVDVAQFNDKNVRHMMTQILRMSESRRLLVGCGEVLGTMKSFDLDVAKKKLQAISRPVSIADKDNAGHYLDDYEQRVEMLEEKKKIANNTEAVEVGIPVGIYRFDHACGGIMRKEFGVVAGVTGVGKTAALICFGLHAWIRGYNVMLVSGEMSKDLLEFRIDSNLTGISGMSFRNADLSEEDYAKWDAAIRMYRTTQENFLFIATYPRKFTTATIEHDMIRLQEETGKKVDIICVDYLNIMDTVGIHRGVSSKEWTSQADAVWDLKALVAEHNIVGWTASQVIDEAFDKELYDVDDLKYSRAISETAPVVVSLIRSPKDVLENRMKFQIMKMRNAPLPKKPIILTPNLNIMRIHEELVKTKTLRGFQGDVLDDVHQKSRSVRPKRSLHNLRK